MAPNPPLVQQLIPIRGQRKELVQHTVQNISDLTMLQDNHSGTPPGTCKKMRDLIMVRTVEACQTIVKVAISIGDQDMLLSNLCCQ